MAFPQPRPTILSIEPYVGGESKIDGVNRIIKLSSNEGAFGVPPGAVAAMQRVAPEMFRYPDGSAAALRNALGKRFDLNPAKIVCGCGSDELIGHLILSYGGEGTELVMSAHGFVMYEIYGKYAGCHVIKVPEKNLTADIDAMLAAVGPRTKLVCLVNPNNPTGTLLPKSEVARLRRGLRDDILLILDAAYAEYVSNTAYDAGVEMVDAGTNTVMTRTFSKVFGLGGVRLGWCYAPPAVTDILNRVRSPFNVNASAMAAGIGALEEAGWVEMSVAHNAEWRERLSTGLRELGLVVYPSEANFILVDFTTAERAKAADAALRSRGLIVRGVGSYSLPTCLRMTIGTAEECTLLLEAVKAFIRA